MSNKQLMIKREDAAKGRPADSEKGRAEHKKNLKPDLRTRKPSDLGPYGTGMGLNTSIIML